MSKQYRRKGEVRAERITERIQWQTQAGDTLIGEPGDWLVTDTSGGKRTVKDDPFRLSHDEVAPGRYRRSGTVTAYQVQTITTVETLEGAATANPGDWVLQRDFNDRWPVPDAHFRASYEEIP